MCIFGRLWLLSFLLWHFFSFLNCGVPGDFVEFYRLPEKERMRVFHGLPIEKQIDYHLYAMLREPPDQSFSKEIARQGEPAIQAVLYRIAREDEDFRKVDLLEIVADFCQIENCKENKPDIINAVEQEVRKIKDPNWRALAEKSVSYMKGNPVPLPQIR